MDCADIALVVLAAGRSKRFGRQKLLMPLGGQPLGCVTASRLAPLPFCARFAVVASDQTELANSFGHLGFTVIANADPEAGLSQSLGLALSSLQSTPAEAVLLCLADMPNVSVDHVLRLIAAVKRGQIASSRLGEARMPPAVFPRNIWANMLHSTGDQGARHLLGSATSIEADEWTLRDIDTPDIFEEVSRAYRPAKGPCPDPS